MEIILIKHGKPTGSNNPKLSAVGFAKWVRQYHYSKIEAESIPPEQLGPSLNLHFIIGSDLPRAINSAQLCVNRQPDLILKSLREMDIPRWKLPFKFKAYTWLSMVRILWMLGFNGKVESFKTAKFRAKISAETLHALAIEHKKIAVFGHGMLNRQITKELKKLGWAFTTQGKSYWSTTKLTL